MVRDVVVFPDRRLKRVCVPVGTPGPAARRLARDLIDTAASFPRTTGIAAPQVGELWRMCFIDCTGNPRVPDPLGPVVMVDPVLTHYAGDEVGREGCLSLPQVTANVQRGTEIGVRYLDPEGRRHEVVASGFEARVILHEMDHLDGILILDRVRSLSLDVFPRVRRSGRQRGKGGTSRHG
jgi:peptide deformylase